MFEQDNDVVFDDGRIVERASDGRESVWGNVTRWEPPASLRFTWHPGYGEEHATEVVVSFTASDDQTLVSLVHTGWERMNDPFARAAEYANGWPAVLAGFAALAGSS